MRGGVGEVISVTTIDRGRVVGAFTRFFSFSGVGISA